MLTVIQQWVSTLATAWTKRIRRISGKDVAARFRNYRCLPDVDRVRDLRRQLRLRFGHQPKEPAASESSL